MHILGCFFSSTVGRKFLMALSGIVLVLFVLGHMVGNLQIFLGPDVINAYAYKLHHELPTSLLWAVRVILLLTIGVHIWAAVSLTIDNRRARPDRYDAKKTVQASYASRTMRMSGIILLAFIVYHIAHFTARSIPGKEYNEPGVLAETEVPLLKQGEPVFKNGEAVMTFNVNDMMIAGFEVWWVSAFYIVATGLLCLHLTHGVSSMFQTLGLSNRNWRVRLDRVALVYGWVVFLGFASIPAAVLTNVLQADPTGGVDPVQATHAIHSGQ
ncbi:MAG: succinate dehydrogenase cytochrome b subunit [Coraliomargaritaceae bacterium]